MVEIDEPVFNSESLIDPELDFRSERFNPLKALYSPDALTTIKNIKVYNNLAQFESFVMKGRDSVQVTEQSNPISSISERPQQIIDLFGRRFLPHQEMVKGTGKKARHKRNLILKMTTHKFEGPMDVLKLWKSNGSRVKIHTRNANSVNGYITGKIEAFDKHWNISLTEVFEEWKRKKLHHSPQIVPDRKLNAEVIEKQCEQRLNSMNIKLPPTAIKSISRKLVKCSRRISKLLVRGEHIAFITLETNTEAERKSH